MSANPGRKRKFRVLKRIITTLIILGLIGGGAYYYFFLREKPVSAIEVVAQQTAAAYRGDISVTISGAGPVAYSTRRQVKSEVKGTVLQANFNEGDLVKAGDVIFEVDNKEALDKIAQIENSIKQQKLSSSSSTDIGSMVITAPCSGVVTSISVTVGDNVNKGAVVMAITDKNNLSVLLPFAEEDVSQLQEGQAINLVNIDGELEYCPAKVTAIQHNAGGVGYVQITTQVSKYLKNGSNVVAVVGEDGIRALDTGSLSYKTEQSVKSMGTGTATVVDVKLNDYVTEGQTVVRMNNTDVAYTTELNELKLESLENDLKAAVETLDYYVIYAPIDGMFVSQPISKDDYIEVNQIVAEIVDPNSMEFTTDVDELDIDKVSVGQSVDVSFDAIENTTINPIKGEIKKIAIEGSSSGGVTTYGVTVNIEPNARVKAGMNADGVIYIDSKSDVLLIPVEAVTIIGGNRAMVYVKSEAESSPDAAGTGMTPDGEMPMNRQIPESAIPNRGFGGEIPNGAMPNGEAQNMAMPNGERPNREMPNGEWPSRSAQEGDWSNRSAQDGEWPNRGMPDGERPNRAAMDGERPTRMMQDGGVPPDGDRPSRTIQDGAGSQNNNIPTEGMETAQTTTAASEDTLPSTDKTISSEAAPGARTGGMDGADAASTEAAQNRPAALNSGTVNSAAQNTAAGRNNEGNGEVATRGGFGGRRIMLAEGTPGTGYYEGAVVRIIEYGISNDSLIEVVSGLAEGEIVVLPQMVNNDAVMQGGFGQRMQGGMMMQFGGPGGGAAAPAGGGRTMTITGTRN